MLFPLQKTLEKKKKTKCIHEAIVMKRKAERLIWPRIYALKR